MATIKYSGLVTGIKGVLGGSVLSLNQGGYYIRTRTTGGSKSMPVWQKQKGLFSFLAQEWRTLNDSQRAAWSDASPSYPTVDKFGNTRYPSGFELYMRLNGSLIVINNPTISEPLTPVTVPPVASPELTYAGTAIIKFSFDNSLSDKEVIQLQMSKAVSQGQTVCKAPFKIVAAINNSSAPPINVDANYKALFSTPPNGSRVFFKALITNTDTGQQGIQSYGFLDIN